MATYHMHEKNDFQSSLTPMLSRHPSAFWRPSAWIHAADRTALLIVVAGLTIFSLAPVNAQDRGPIREEPAFQPALSKQAIQLDVFTRAGQSYGLTLYEGQGIYIGRGRVREMRQITFPVDSAQFNKLIETVRNTPFFEGAEIQPPNSFQQAGVSIVVRMAGKERKRTFHPLDRTGWLIDLVTQIEMVANSKQFRCPFSAPYERGGSAVDFCKLNEEFLNGGLRENAEK